MYFLTFVDLIGATPQPTYHLLVHNQNASQWMRNFWNHHIDGLWKDGDDFHQIRDQTYWMFHLKTDNLNIRFTRNTKIRPFVSILSMHFVFPFCRIKVGYIVVPISKQTWETEASFLSDFSRFLPLRVYAGLSSKSESFKIRFTLRNLISQPKTALIDRGLAELIFPNTTFYSYSYKHCFCCKLNLPHNPSLGSIERFERIPWHIKTYAEFPTLGIRVRDVETFLTTVKDEYTFLTCGDPYNDPPDFLVLFRPFSNFIWALILVIILGWPLVLSLIEKDFKWKTVLRDSNALFIGLAMILEQTHLRATNYKRKGPLYFYCGCVLLAMFILSISHKGDNVSNQTMKSFELVPLTNMAQVKNAGYITRSVKGCWKILGSNICLDMFEHEANLSQMRHEYTDEQQYKLWKPMDNIVQNHSLLSLVFNSKPLVESDFDLEVEFVGECVKDALLGWRSKLLELEKDLRMEYKGAQIYVGKEFIFSRRKGWQLQRYGSVKVLKRIWTAVESGIYSKILNLSHKPRVDEVVEPRRLTIYQHISVPLVYHSFGLLLAFVVFITEVKNRIALWFDNPFSMVQIEKLSGVNFWNIAFRLHFSLKLNAELYCIINRLHHTINHLERTWFCIFEVNKQYTSQRYNLWEPRFYKLKVLMIIYIHVV